MKDLTDLGLWSDTMKHQLIAHGGSVQVSQSSSPTQSYHVLKSLSQNIDEIPDELKALYKTVWEIPQKTLINMAADRGAFVDQSQSFNVHMAETNFGKMSSMHFYAWKKVLDCNNKKFTTRD